MGLSPLQQTASTRFAGTGDIIAHHTIEWIVFYWPPGLSVLSVKDLLKRELRDERILIIKFCIGEAFRHCNELDVSKDLVTLEFIDWGKVSFMLIQ